MSCTVSKCRHGGIAWHCGTALPHLRPRLRQRTHPLADPLARPPSGVARAAARHGVGVRGGGGRQRDRCHRVPAGQLHRDEQAVGAHAAPGEALRRGRGGVGVEGGWDVGHGPACGSYVCCVQWCVAAPPAGVASTKQQPDQQPLRIAPLHTRRACHCVCVSWSLPPISATHPASATPYTSAAAAPQGSQRDRDKRERERQQLADLVGKNLTYLSQLDGLDLALYRDVVLPRCVGGWRGVGGGLRRGVCDIVGEWVRFRGRG